MPVPIAPETLPTLLADLPGWEVVDGQLVCERRFPAYLDGVRFAAAVAEVAERMNHHPDIHITWRKVRLSIHTHSIGALSDLDFAFAQQVMALQV